MIENNELTLGSKGTVEDQVHVLHEDRAGISRSKLEHLKDLAEDDRMEESTGIHNIISNITLGIFFTSLGVAFAFNSLSQMGKYLCLIGLLVGLFGSIYSLYNHYTETEKRKKHRRKIVDQINKIISQMNKGLSYSSEENTN